MKQVVVLRRDLDMSTGKLIAQAVHASHAAVDSASSEDVEAWRGGGEKVVAARVDGEDALQDVLADAERRGLPTGVVTDAGRTEVPAGTKTAVGVGPAADARVDKVTKELPLM